MERYFFSRPPLPHPLINPAGYFPDVSLSELITVARNWVDWLRQIDRRTV